MGLLDRILGSKAELGAEPFPAVPAGRDSSAVRGHRQTWLGLSILGVVAAYAIATTVWVSWESESASVAPTGTDLSGSWFDEGAWFLDF